MPEPYFILELTTRCNLDCIYCYNVWKQQDGYQQKDIMLHEVKDIVNNIRKNASIRGMTLAGGEPLLNNNIFEIAEYLKSEKIKTAFTSNGLLLTEANISHLIHCGVEHIEISMPSVENAVYEKLCRTDALKSVRTAILKTRKENVKLTVTAVITQLNLDEVYDIIELSAVFGADYIALNRFVPGGKGLKYKDELALNKKQHGYMLEQASKAAKTFGVPVIVAIPLEQCQIETSLYANLYFGTCVCGDYKWVVDPYGNLRACEQNPFVIGSLLNTDFNTLSQHPSVSVFREDDKYADCKTKPCYTNCGGGCRFCK